MGLELLYTAYTGHRRRKESHYAYVGIWTRHSIRSYNADIPHEM